MPLPKPEHQPTFTDEQLALARKIAAQRHGSISLIRRALLTLVLAEQPDISHAAAARRCGLARDTVYKWRRRWKQAGWSLEDAPRPGRPRSFSP